MNYTHEYEERKERSAPKRPVILPPEEKTLYRQATKYLEGRDLDAGLAFKNGWYPCYDYMRTPRIVIPATSQINTWPYYQARAMVEDPKRYMSPSAPRGDALAVVLPHDVSSAQGVGIVEGPMDALAIAGEGYVGIGLMGNKPNAIVVQNILEHLDTYGPPCFLIPDKDAYLEGVEVAYKIWVGGYACSLITLQRYKDFADVPRRERRAILREHKKDFYHDPKATIDSA